MARCNLSFGAKYTFLFFIVSIIFISACIQPSPEGGSEESKAQVDSIVSSIDQNDDQSVLDAGDKLSNLGEPAIPSILDKMSPTEDAGTRWASVYALNVVASDAGPEAREELKGSIPAYYTDNDKTIAVMSAAVGLGLGDKKAFPILISGLRSTQTMHHTEYKMPVSKYCNQVLKAYTGKDFGYNNSVPMGERESAIQAWENWWNSNSESLVWNPNAGEYGMYE